MFLTTFTSNISVSLTVSSQYGRQLQTLITIIRMFYFNHVFIRLLLRFIRVLLLFHRIIPKIFKFIVPNKIKRSVIFSPLRPTNQTAKAICNLTGRGLLPELLEFVETQWINSRYALIRDKSWRSEAPLSYCVLQITEYQLYWLSWASVLKQ